MASRVSAVSSFLLPLVITNTLVFLLIFPPPVYLFYWNPSQSSNKTDKTSFLLHLEGPASSGIKSELLRKDLCLPTLKPRSVLAPATHQAPPFSSDSRPVPTGGLCLSCPLCLHGSRAFESKATTCFRMWEMCCCIRPSKRDYKLY